MNKIFKLEIIMENDAFCEEPILEIADILKKLIKRLENNSRIESYIADNFCRNLMDSNGNVTGTYGVFTEVEQQTKGKNGN